MEKFILNEKIVDKNEAFIHVSDLALLRGYGVFDFFRLDGGIPMFMDEHIDRFYQSAKYLYLKPPYSKDTLKTHIKSMLRHNKMTNSGVRMVLTGGESPNGYEIGKPTLFVLNEPINSNPTSGRKNGVRLISKEYQRDIPQAKTINYLVGIHNLPNVNSKNAHDTLYHYHGNILELTRANFFLVNQRDEIITAKENILKGINRKVILTCCKNEFKTEERELKLDELKNAKEAFITGTNKRVIPVNSIDDIIIGNGKPGPITSRIQQLFDKHIEEYKGITPALF